MVPVKLNGERKQTHKCQQSKLHLCHFIFTKIRFILVDGKVGLSFKKGAENL